MTLDNPIEGRRRYRHRRFAQASVAAATVAVAMTTAPTPALALGQAPNGDRAAAAIAAPDEVKCRVQTLTAPPGDGSVRVDDADPTGRFIVGSVTRPDGTQLPVRWDNGSPTVLPAQGDVANSLHVNRQGTVVGNTFDDDGVHGWIYKNGAGRRLAADPRYPSSVVRAINARGDIAGAAWNDEREVAVRWSGPASRPTLLPADAIWASAKGISDDGTVVGDLGDGAKPYAWSPGGTGRALRLTPGTDRGKAMGIRGNWAFGYTRDSNGGGNEVDLVRVRWNMRTGAVSVVPGEGGLVTAINARGWMVANALPGESTPQLIRNGQVFTPTPDTTEPYQHMETVAITDSGAIVGNMIVGGSARPTVWTC